MPLRETSTGGLPQLVRTLHEQRPNAAKDPNAAPPSSGVALMALLHCVVLVLLIVATVTTNEARDFRDAAAFLPNGGALPTSFLTLSATNVVLYVLFVVLSLIDGAWFLATNVHVTGLGLGFGLASAMLTGSLTLLASVQLNETAFFVYLIAFVGANVVIALQLATILSILVQGDSELLRAIRVSI